MPPHPIPPFSLAIATHYPKIPSALLHNNKQVTDVGLSFILLCFTHCAGIIHQSFLLLTQHPSMLFYRLMNDRHTTSMIFFLLLMDYPPSTIFYNHNLYSSSFFCIILHPPPTINIKNKKQSTKTL